MAIGEYHRRRKGAPFRSAALALGIIKADARAGLYGAVRRRDWGYTLISVTRLDLPRLDVRLAIVAAVENANRFGKIGALDLLNKVENVALFSAAEAMEPFNAIFANEDRK
ncbi:hypothetical protein [Rhizobium ruizarguesonis]